MNILNKLAIAGLLLGSVSADDIGGVVETSLKSKFIGRAGFDTGSGPVNQSLVAAKKGNISGFVWTNADLTDNAMHEIDIGVNYHVPNLFGSKKLSGKVSLQHWRYPSDEIPRPYDHMGEVSVGYSGAVNLDLTLSHIFTDRLTADRNMIYGQLSKPIEIVKSKRGSFSLIPKLSSAWDDNYFWTDGFMHATPALDLKLSRGNWDVTVSGAHQKSFQDGIPSVTYGGASIGYNF
tara:strand:+ start:879 stop:1580 length:702 start_codon:yes stop_codon:yes gene_type:complete